MKIVIEITNSVLPVFLVMGAGFVLAAKKLMAPPHQAWLSWLVFWVASPALLFRSAARTSLATAFSAETIMVAMFITLFLAVSVYLAAFRASPSRRGVLAQGSFRTNLVFVGLPVLANALGDSVQVMGPAAVLIGFMTPFYNLVSVIALTLPHRQSNPTANPWKKTLIEITTNPLILSCALGMVFSGLHLSVPVSLDRALDMVGKTATPLALLAVGAGLEVRKLKADFALAAVISALKLIVYPGLVALLLYGLGHRGLELAVPTLLFCAPTAVVSPIMAREMKGDDQLASSFVILSTLSSLLTISAWVALFKLSLL